MIITIKARTRQHLGSRNLSDRVQVLLHNLADDFLGSILVEEMDKDDQRDAYRLNLAEQGSLASHIDAELLRADEGRRKWKASMKGFLPDQLPFERQSGRVHFESLDRSKEVHLSFDEFELAPNLDNMQFGNYLSIISEEKQHGEELAKKYLSVLERLFDNDLFDHGFCCLSDQYDEKNLDRSEGGVRAVGLDASKCLPGFYWGNYFGDYLCKHIGESRLLEVPSCRSKKLQYGVLVTNELPPDSWNEPNFIHNENLAMDHIGRQLFYEKGKELTEKLFS